MSVLGESKTVLNASMMSTFSIKIRPFGEISRELELEDKSSVSLSVSKKYGGQNLFEF